jgi:hypothetical protein
VAAENPIHRHFRALRGVAVFGNVRAASRGAVAPRDARKAAIRSAASQRGFQ